MTDIRVDRISVRCPTGADRDATTVRRARARSRRLAVIARDRLPAQIERRLGSAGGPPREITVLDVPIDFDPDGYDDETVAALWADRVVTAIEHVVDASSDDGARTSTGTTSPAAEETPTAARARLQLEAWLLCEIRERGDELLDVLALDHRRLVEIHRSIDSVARRTLLADRERFAHQIGGPPDPVPEPETARPEETAAIVPPPGPSGMDNDTDTSIRRFVRTMSSPPDAAVDAAAQTGAPISRGESSLDLTLETHLDLVRNETRSRRTTSCAGLVLLYPWLARLFETAERLDEPVETARRAALSRLAFGTDALVDDPLVLALSGVEADATPPRLGALTRSELNEPISSVLENFAGCLPGFAASTQDFLRDELVLRDGTLESVDSDVQLLPARRPLDPVLAMLPYPISLVQFPWTEPIHVVWPS